MIFPTPDLTTGPAKFKAADGRAYLSGFGNEHLTEAIAGAVPEGRNSPQRAPHGLYAEQLSGTAFTAPRSSNLRTWVYRIRPSAQHPEFRPLASGTLFSAPFTARPPDPNRLRWDPLPIPVIRTDFVDGLYTMGGNGDALSHTGIAIHLYAANSSMQDRYFVNSDGELLLVPQAGGWCFAQSLELSPCSRGGSPLFPAASGSP